MVMYAKHHARWAIKQTCKCQYYLLLLLLLLLLLRLSKKSFNVLHVLDYC